MIKQSLIPSSWDICNNLIQIFWVLQELKPSPRWRMLGTFWEARLVGTERWMIEIPLTSPCYLTTNQSEESHTPYSHHPQMMPLKTIPWKLMERESLGLSSRNHLFLHGPCNKLSLLQILIFLFVCSHCSAGTGTWVCQQKMTLSASVFTGVPTIQ